LFSTVVFAAGNTFAGFGDRLPVYMIGDASGAADAFNFVAMLINNNVLYSIILAGVIVALIRMSMKLMDHSAEGTLGEFLYIFVVYIFFLSPSSDIAVVDARVYSSGVNLPDVNATASTGYVSYQTVDNIPLGIAAIASFSTVVSWDFAKLIDTVISPVGSVGGQYLGITRAGYSAPAKDMRWAMRNIANGIGGEKSHKDYEYMFFQYVRECALPTVDVDIRNASKIMNPPDGDYKTYLSPASLPVGGTQIQDPITKVQVDCITYWNTNLSGVEAAFENNLLAQFRTHKGFDANGMDPNYEAGLRNLLNGASTGAIASLKDSFGALKRASIVKQSIAASGTGISGIDMANQMAMTEAKQSSMIQGASTWAWIGEMLPVGINISIGFLVVMSTLMSVFLLFQGWVKGMKVILNFAAGFFALTFSYVSLAITQGIVNRRAYYDVVEQYASQGHPMQVSNYNFMLENAASMEGMTGLLGSLFVVAGSASVFYGESKLIVGGMMGKVQGAFGGNNLDKQLDDNAKDKALAESMMEEDRKGRMAGKLADAGIPVNGGNIEYEYAKFQKELSEIGSAKGTHMAMTGDATIDGDASIEDRISNDTKMKEGAGNAIANTMAGTAVQSFEKAKSVQGYGHEATIGGTRSATDAMTAVEAGSFAKGRGAAAASLGESALLQTKQKADSFVEGMKRDAQVKTSKTIGVGTASPDGGMSNYLDNIEKDATVGFLSQGIKAEAVGKHGLKDGSNSKIDKDYGEGIYRGEASNIESTKMKAKVLDEHGNIIGREDYIKNSAANAFKQEVMGQAAGKKVRERFGDDMMGLASSVPYEGEKIPTDASSGTGSKVDRKLNTRTNEELVSDIVGTKDLQTPLQKNVAAMLKGVEKGETSLDSLKDMLSGMAPTEETQKMLSSLAKMTTVGKIGSALLGAISPSKKEETGPYDPSMPESVFNVAPAPAGPRVQNSSKTTSTPREHSDNNSASTTKPENPETRSVDSSKNKGLGLPFSPSAPTKEEKNLMAASGLDLKNIRRNKNAIIGHESSGDLNSRLHAENTRGYIGMAQFGAAALSDVGMVNKKKYMAATHKTRAGGRVFNKGVTRQSFLADDSNWNIEGGKSSYMNSFELQDKSLSKLMTQNSKTLKRNGVGLGNSSHTKGLLMASHLGGAGNAIKFAKHGIGFRDGNGTSIGSYYHAGANDITRGSKGYKGKIYGGSINSSGGGVRSTNTGSMSIGAIAESYARKEQDEWVSGGQAIANTYQKDSSAYATAAAFRESGALMTSQNIQAKGGLNSAISQGVMGAASAGSAEKAAFVGEKTQQLIASGMNPMDAKKLSESIASGSEQGAEKFKQAIMSASASSAMVSASEKEGTAQSHAKKLSGEFGESLTEKESKASKKTFIEEQVAISEDTQGTKKKAWENRAKSLEEQKKSMSSFAGDSNKVAAVHVADIMDSAIMSDSSLNNTGRIEKKQQAAALVKRVSNGDDVTTEDITRGLGKTTGDKVVKSLENNGVVFDDADGIFTGNSINATKTGKKIKSVMAGQVIMGALQQQSGENKRLLENGSISNEEYQARGKKIQYLSMGASGKNGGSMPIEYFRDAGFSQDKLDGLGIKQADTEHANGRVRMFQSSHVDADSILNSRIDSIDKEIKKESPKEVVSKRASSSSSVKNPSTPKDESKAHSWNELAEAQEGKRVKEFVGSGSGIIEKVSQNPNVYSENAMYGELSKASTTQAKIEAQGGIHKAVTVDTAESFIKAGMQKGSVAQQAAELAGGGAEGTKIAEAIKNGSAEGADLLSAGIIRAAQSLGGAQSGAKTRGDMKNIEMTGGEEAFIQSAGVEGGKKGIVAKTQNIDLLDQEKSQNYINDIDSQVLQHQSDEKRQTSVDRMKSAGMITQDSTVNDLNATSGETFAFAQAKLAAGAMDRSERFAIGGTSINAVRDTETGHARIESNSGNTFSDGDQVNHNYGVNVKNPMQFGAQYAGLETVKGGTDDGSVADTGAMGVAIGVAGAVVATSTYGAVNKASGGKLSTAVDSVGHKIKGNIGGKDIDGNKGVFYSEENWDSLEKEGMAEKSNSGWELKKDRKEAKAFINTQPSSNVKNFQANNKTSPTTAPIINSNIESPSNIYSSSDVSKYNTKSGNTAMLNELGGMSNKEIGKKALLSEAKTAQSSANADLAEVSKSGDVAKIDEAKAKVGATNTVVNKLQGGKAPTAWEAKNAGLDTSFTDGKNIDLDGLGSATRTVEEAKLNNNISAIDEKNAPTKAKAAISKAITANTNRAALNSFGDTGEGSTYAKAMDNIAGLEEAKETISGGGKVPEYALRDMGVDTAKGNFSDSVVDRVPRPPEVAVDGGGKTAKGAGGLIQKVMMASGLGAVIGTSLDAKGFSTPEVKGVPSQVNTDGVVESAPLSNVEKVALSVQGGFNALNAVGAGMEIKNGASTNVADLGKASSYKDGFKAVAKDAVDISDFKGVASSFADEGAVQGVKLGGKALAKSAMKKLPFVGVAAGAAFAYDRASDGDYMGAAMEFASGAVSMIPGVGTAASVAIDGALMKRDYDANHPDAPQTVASTENNVTPISQGTPSLVGSSVAPSVAPSGQGMATPNSHPVASSNEAPISTPIPANNASSAPLAAQTQTPQVTPSVDASGSNIGQNNVGTNANSPLPSNNIRDNFNAVSNNVRSMDNVSAGESHLASVTPSENRSEIIEEARGGTLTRTKMVEKGVSKDIAEQTPVNDSGFVDVEKSGSMYKEGLASMDSVMNMPSNPSFKYGDGVVNSPNSANMSNVAASSLATGFSPSMVVPPQDTSVAQANVASSTTVMPTQAVASAEPSTTIVKETVVVSGGESGGGTSTISIDSTADSVSELAKATTSPGNIQVQNADLKKSIDSLAVDSIGQQMPQATPQQIDLNSLALGDLASGVAMNAPIQTMGGELTLGSQGGFVTLGQGENPYVTNVPTEAIQNAPESSRDVLASTLSNTKLNNGDVQEMSRDDAGIATKMGHTEEIMQEMNVIGQTKAVDDRLVLSDQVELLGGIIDELEKTRLSSAAENKGVA
jgi:hypothetical protein